jgi:hypothetical protein
MERFSTVLEKIFSTQDGEELAELLKESASQWIYHPSGLQEKEDIAYRQGQADFARLLLELGGTLPHRGLAYTNPAQAVPSRVDVNSYYRTPQWGAMIAQIYELEQKDASKEAG